MIGPIEGDLIKLAILVASPLIAFLSLIIWLAVTVRRNHSLTVGLRFLGLNLNVSARPVQVERRGRDKIESDLT